MHRGGNTYLDVRILEDVAARYGVDLPVRLLPVDAAVQFQDRDSGWGWVTLIRGKALAGVGVGMYEVQLVCDTDCLGGDLDYQVVVERDDRIRVGA